MLVCQHRLILPLSQLGLLAGCRRTRCRGFARFPTAFVESGGCVERLTNIPAKGRDVIILVRYQRISFAAVFQGASNKANLGSVAHTTPSAGRICVGDLQLWGLYLSKKNLSKTDMHFGDSGSSSVCIWTTRLHPSCALGAHVAFSVKNGSTVGRIYAACDANVYLTFAFLNF